jgi:beta-phosphoglucomutase-like phosphatase (HAD superfamily)
MTRLAIFDLDGTLTDTNAVDDECYLEAMSTELGCAPNPDWTT